MCILSLSCQDTEFYKNLDLNIYLQVSLNLYSMYASEIYVDQIFKNLNSFLLFREILL